LVISAERPTKLVSAAGNPRVPGTPPMAGSYRPNPQVNRSLERPQYGLATNRSWAGNRVSTFGPVSVMTISSSIRAAEKPSEAGQ
jgi:hypothetical protein